MGSASLFMFKSVFPEMRSMTSRRLFSTEKNRLAVSWLDLRGSGISILERLLLEECLLRHDDRNWIIAGQHEAVPHRYLQRVEIPAYIQQARHSEMYNPNTAIVMGIGGKPDKLLNKDLVRDEGCLVLKRFSGGGTVVLDHDSIWTTLIFRNSNAINDDPLPEAFPRLIMDWSAKRIFGQVFAELKAKQLNASESTAPNEKMTMVLDSKSCGTADDNGKVVMIPAEPVTIPGSRSTEEKPHILPNFELEENDYILGNRKMAGNAQSIVKNGWLHHTSFLWDYQDENMQYLTLPDKRPEYRKDRDHGDFLVKLSHVYPSLTKKQFVTTMNTVCEREFESKRVTLPEAMKVVNNIGGMQEWFDGKARTRIVDLETD